MKNIAVKYYKTNERMIFLFVKTVVLNLFLKMWAQLQADVIEQLTEEKDRFIINASYLDTYTEVYASWAGPTS